MKIMKSALFLVALPAILIAIWWIATLNNTSYLVPTPGGLITAFFDTWFGDRFWDDMVPSIARLFGGIAGAIIVGVGLGLLIGSFRTLRQLLEPLLEFFRAIPPPVLVPLLGLILGISDQMKITVIIFGSVWPILLNTIEGVRATDEVQRDTARSYRLTRPHRLRYLILPAAAPQIMAGIRQSLSIALILMVISEMTYSSSGLGFAIIQFQRNFAIPQMWSGILVLGLIGLALSLVFQLVERRVLAWYNGLREVQRA
ncbi:MULTISPECIES: ABC transporter permease [Microbacterium]|uniref:ABC-type nitrate/sulfonate/bicarbonate transport system, permease component n=1 Tax=Microbacterium saccharophilum TaxID=1213358 RepID=A0A7Z7GDX3_9MICO|nr:MULTISPECIES: ABC transporter permease [Microbacterium]SFI72121.1 ABC-type nitrate/sulfonate/bicarbonate transport system, permease component [Microbacterium saccharophilum]